MHFNKIFFAHDRFDHESQIFGNGIPKRLTHDLARVLYSKFYFQLFIPVGIDFESSFPDPFGIIFVDVFDDKVVLDVEFFQSCQD